MNGEDTTTLGRDDYCSPAVFAAERHRLFDRGWFYACHADSLPARHRRVVDVAGESAIVARDAKGSCTPTPTSAAIAASRLCEAADARRQRAGDGDARDHPVGRRSHGHCRSRPARKIRRRLIRPDLDVDLTTSREASRSALAVFAVLP
jgi:hypothetical protein